MEDRDGGSGAGVGMEDFANYVMPGHQTETHI